MEPARMDLRAGLDRPLRDDGRRRVARLEARRLRRTARAAGIVPRPARPQRPVDPALLRPALDRPRIRGNHPHVVCHRRHNRRVPESLPSRRLAARAVSCMGRLRRRPQRDPVVDEPIIGSRPVGSGNFLPGCRNGRKGSR